MSPPPLWPGAADSEPVARAAAKVHVAAFSKSATGCSSKPTVAGTATVALPTLAVISPEPLPCLALTVKKPCSAGVTSNRFLS